MQLKTLRRIVHFHKLAKSTSSMSSAIGEADIEKFVDGLTDKVLDSRKGSVLISFVVFRRTILSR